MKMTSRLLIAILATSATCADAHDFWLQPARWRVSVHEPIAATLQVGHGPNRQRSPISARRILRFEAFDPLGRRIDLKKNLSMGAPGADAAFAFGEPGVHVVVLETDDRAESHLPAIRFNDYLKVEGLTPAIMLRAKTGRDGADGAENYSRHAKMLVQVGPDGERGSARVVRPAGLELEIVPETNPLSLHTGNPLAVRIYYRGRPLGGALVKLNDLNNDEAPIQMRRSDGRGRASFTLPGKGSWQLNVIWTRPQPASSLTDFETSFSSLSFGIVG